MVCLLDPQIKYLFEGTENVRHSLPLELLSLMKRCIRNTLIIIMFKAEYLFKAVIVMIELY